MSNTRHSLKQVKHIAIRIKYRACDEENKLFIGTQGYEYLRLGE